MNCSRSHWRHLLSKITHKNLVNNTNGRRCFSDSAEKPGLFSVVGLCQPRDFPRLAQEAIRECDEIRHRIHENPSLMTLDSISRIVCNVIDAAELARNVHTDEHWREAAENAFAVLSDYLAQLNGDPSIYEALLKCDIKTEEDARFVQELRAEFERDGIHLPVEKREAVREIQGRLLGLETLFARNLSLPGQDVWLDADDVHEIIPSSSLNSIGMGKSDGNRVQVDGNSSEVLQALLRYSGSTSLRKDAYLALHTSVSENLPVLNAMIEARHELATVQGFPSYAHRFLEDKMLDTPAAVADFLNQQQRQLQPFYMKECEIFRAAKRHVEGTTEKIQPWDVPFYSSVLKNQESNGNLVDSASTYFTLEATLRSLQTLVERLFGIKMTEETLGEGEGWAEGVRRYRLVHLLDEVEIGTLYWDICTRTNKHIHAAHFSIRCGCTLSDGSVQEPVVALVGNIVGASNTLSHAQVETIYHEFGHALHSLLSRTTYQHLSGTRGALDFAEIPSHLIENYVWDADFLSLCFETLPQEIISAVVSSRNTYSATERYHQLLFSKLDQRLFGGMRVSDTSAHNATLRVYSDLHKEMGMPYVEGCHWYSRFTHLVSYGAGYYGYQFAKSHANTVWTSLLQGRCLDPKAGTILRHEFLQYGGARSPNLILDRVSSASLSLVG